MIKKVLLGLVSMLWSSMVFGQKFNDLNTYTILIENSGVYSKSQYDTLLTDLGKKCLVLTKESYFAGKLEDLNNNPDLLEKRTPDETDMIRLIGELESGSSYFCTTTRDEGTHTGGNMNKFLRVSTKIRNIEFVFWRSGYIPIFTSLVKKETMKLPKFSWKKQPIAKPKEAAQVIVAQEQDISDPTTTTIESAKKSHYHEVQSPWPTVFKVILWIIGTPVIVYLVYWMLFGKPRWP